VNSSVSPGSGFGERKLLLSHLQIDDYLTCPLKYKYVHVLRVPVSAHHAIIYGSAVHEAIQFYYKNRMDGRPNSLEEIIKNFEAHWESAGFLSREHEEQRLEEGMESLRRFFHREERNKTVPSFIEKKFRFAFGKDTVIGRFDRVDVTPSGAVVIDFKTSDIKTKEEADERAAKSTQLAVYALAWQTLAGELPLSLELHFVDTGVKGSMIPDADTIEKISETIRAVSAGISCGDFKPNPQYLSCNYCPFSDICPGVKK
jgi:DNA helicase-2/ATP-dependent DNA helicase PcrA